MKSFTFSTLDGTFTFSIILINLDNTSTLYIQYKKDEITHIVVKSLFSLSLSFFFLFSTFANREEIPLQLVPGITGSQSCSLFCSPDDNGSMFFLLFTMFTV